MLHTILHNSPTRLPDMRMNPLSITPALYTVCEFSDVQVVSARNILPLGREAGNLNIPRLLNIMRKSRKDRKSPPRGASEMELPRARVEGR